ncbi:MAG: CHAD domain-containing protein [Methyloligella sp. ZOD6]
MGYSLDPALPVTHSVRQVALSELDSARSWLTDPDIHTGIHNARKSLKRLRSLLRLIESGVPEPLFDHLRARLRDIGKELAPARDAQALMETLEKLGRKSPKLTDGDMYGQMRTWLEGRLGRLGANGTDPVAKAVEDLDRLRPTFAKLSVFPDDFETLREGAIKEYRAAREAFREAYKDKSDEAFHEWRKHVQRHWRQLQLLTPCWPETLGARAEHVHTLAKMLGDDHDLANLHQLATAPAMTFGGTGETDKLAKRCRKDQKALRAEAKALGARLFADKPKTFAARIEARWRDAAEAAQTSLQSGPESERETNNVVFFESGRDGETKTG